MSLRQSFMHILGLAADLVGVRSCAVCGDELLPGERGLCLRCLATMPRTDSNMAAVRFADVLSNAVAPQGLTEAWFDYDPASEWAKMIWEAKYHDMPRLARELGYLFGTELRRRHGEVPADVLLPVPMHWRKRMKRGYNQSVEIARGLSQATGIAIGDNLRARSAHKSQTHKGDTARRENVRGIIAVDHPAELDGLRVVIVDDIITTGATISECAAELSLSGARPASIGFITLGATVKKS